MHSSFMNYIRFSCLAFVLTPTLSIIADEPQVPENKERLVGGRGVMVSWSKDNDEIRGYSNELGKWTPLKIDKQELIAPSVDNNLAAVRVGNSVAAYSGKTGRWSLLPLNPPVPAEPHAFAGTFTQDLLQVKSGDHLYTFSAGNSRWTSPSDPEYQESSKEIELKGHNSRIREQLHDWMKSIGPTNTHGGFVMKNVGFYQQALIVTAYRQSWLKKFEAKVAELDVPPARAESGGMGGYFGGGSGGYEGGGGAYGTPMNPNDPRRRMVSGGSLIVSWSKENDELRGFSQERGTWTKLAIKPQKQVVPVVAEHVAAVKLEDGVAGYSAKTGRWDVLKLTEGSAAVPSLESSLIQIVEGDQLYTFAAANGKWTSPTDPEFQSHYHVYYLKNSDASSVRDSLAEMFPSAKDVTFLPDARTNSIFVSGPKGVLEDVAEFISAIDDTDAADDSQPIGLQKDEHTQRRDIVDAIRKRVSAHKPATAT